VTATPEPARVARAGEARRFAGKPFAIGFGTFLIVTTIVFYYFAQRAEIARQQAIEAMEADGTPPASAPGAPD
jgi:hypothetical protein